MSDTAYKKLNSDCYILNAPLRKESDIKKLINTIAEGQKKYKKKYFLIVINIDSHLVEFKLKDIFKKFQMIKLIKAGDTKTLRIYQNKF